MSTEQCAKSLTDLPSDVLVEILARLPLRTLIVSRSVCKTFLSLTNAAQILVFQFGSYSNPSSILHLADPELDRAATQNSDLKPLFHLPRMSENLNFHRNNLPEVNRFSLVNSCNGLVLFYQPDGLTIVCNPVTNEYTLIPKIRVDPLSTSSTWLGFSPGNNQYKVLRISSSIYGYPDKVAAQVLVIGSDSWRDIDTTHMGKYLFFRDLCTTIVDGLMYWYRQGDLVSFDFEREKFGAVALPAEFFRNEYDTTSIGVLGGCLCVACNDYVAQRVYLWVMRKCRDQYYWTKDFVFDTARLTGEPVLGSFKPLQVLRNGEVLMSLTWLRYDLVCYDPKTGTLRYFGLHEIRSDATVVALTPSFVPLKDTLKVEKVMNGYVRPRGDENELSKEGDLGTTNRLSRKNLKKIKNKMRGVVECVCFGNQKHVHQ